MFVLKIFVQLIGIPNGLALDQHIFGSNGSEIFLIMKCIIEKTCRGKYENLKY